MTIKESENAAQKSVISEKVHPGFMCFFRQYLEKASMTFDQCMQSLMEGAAKVPTHLPLSDIIKLDAEPGDKISMLNSKTNEKVSFLYFFKDPEQGSLTPVVIDSAR